MTAHRAGSRACSWLNFFCVFFSVFFVHGQRLLVLACEIGGRWGSDCQQLLRLLLRHRARRTAAAVCAAARSGWQRRWRGLLSVALQQAVASTAQGHLWIRPQQPAGDIGPPLPDILDLACPCGNVSPQPRGSKKGAGGEKKTGASYEVLSQQRGIEPATWHWASNEGMVNLYCTGPMDFPMQPLQFQQVKLLINSGTM